MDAIPEQPQGNRRVPNAKSRARPA